MRRYKPRKTFRAQRILRKHEGLRRGCRTVVDHSGLRSIAEEVRQSVNTLPHGFCCHAEGLCHTHGSHRSTRNTQGAPGGARARLGLFACCFGEFVAIRTV
jgi:hypothetical protein